MEKDNPVDLYILYGSETKLLNGILDIEDSFFIRIYNQRVPAECNNAVDVNDYDAFTERFVEIIAAKNIKRIIFVGAAFIVQNNLFISEKWNSIDKMIKTNISNYLRYVHFLLPEMMKLKAGNFIFLSSFRANITARGVSVYSASKSFCEKFFEVIGQEYGSLGIYSNTIRLGCMDGRMIDVIEENKKKQLLASIGNRRLGNSSDVVDSIKFLLDNNYTNGGTLDLTGGLSY